MHMKPGLRKELIVSEWLLKHPKSALQTKKRILTTHQNLALDKA